MFQSTRLREARHNLTRIQPQTKMFQSTRLREARHSLASQNKTAQSFNPRAYERRDTEYTPFQLPCRVSIHAPTRGATPFFSNISAVRGFNPRAYERRDYIPGALWRRRYSFNPRAYERRDFRYQWVSIAFQCFNPRAYERRDNFFG